MVVKTIILLIETIVAISCLFLQDSKVLNSLTILYRQQMLHVSGQLPKISNLQPIFANNIKREYEASKMAYRDIKNSIDTAKQEGLAEGMEKGMNQKALDIARNMLTDGVDINLIMKYSGLSQEQIEKLK